MAINTVGIFILGILTGWLIEWLFITFVVDKQTNSSIESNNKKDHNKTIEQTTSKMEGVIVKKDTIIKHDDFMRLKGIGPKLAESLKKTHIYHYEELANFTGEELIKKLRASGATIVNRPAFAHIPKQAALAAKGDWDALETLKKSI